MPINNSVSYNNKGNIPTPPPLRTFNPSEKQTEKQQVGLTEKQYQQNMAELKSILSQVDSLMNDGKNSPETVAKCQTLMGYAAAINLPQSRKNQLIGQFPPRVQQMYKQVAKSSEAKTAQRGAMQQAMEVAMAQKHSDIFVQNFNQQFIAGNFSALQGQPPEVWNSCLLNSSINDANSLNVALQNGWDINAKHKNPDGTESTYVEYQGAQIDKGIERANRANATIKDLIGKSPRSKEEEEEYRKAQQAAENHHKNLMGNAQNVVNAIKSGKLNQEEMAKAQAELRKLEEYEKEQRILAQYYRDLAAKETNPHLRAVYLQQADVHKSRENEAKMSRMATQQELLSYNDISKDYSESKNVPQTAQGKQTNLTVRNMQPANDAEVNNLHRELNTNETVAKERQVAQRDLNEMAHSEKPIEDGARMNEEVPGRQTSATQTYLTYLNEFQSGSQNTRLAENSKNQNNIDETNQINQAINSGKLNSEEMAIAQEFREQIDNETDPHTRLSLLAQAKMYETRATKIESNLTNSEYDVNPIISRNITPEGINNLDEKHKDLIMIDRFERPSTREINTTIASTKNSATLSNQENDLSALSNSHRDLSSNKTQTSVSDDFMSMINTISTPQQNTSMSHTKSNSSPSISAPTLPHIAQATQPSQTSKQSNPTSLDLNTTITPTQSIPQKTSGLSNTIKTVANASIVADVSEISTENNVKPLDTSRNI